MTVAVYKESRDVTETGVERFVWEGLHLAMKVVALADVEAHKLAGWALHPYETIVVPDVAPPPLDATPPAPDVGANPFKK